MIETIYPHHELLFTYDTALPMHLMQNILNEVFPDLQPMTEEYSEKYRSVYTCVYAYGKSGDRASGLIPLTKAARDILNRYNQKTGQNVIFTPVIDPYQSAKKKEYTAEFNELKASGQMEWMDLTEYIHNREQSLITFDELKNLIKA